MDLNQSVTEKADDAQKFDPDLALQSIQKIRRDVMEKQKIEDKFNKEILEKIDALEKLCGNKSEDDPVGIAEVDVSYFDSTVSSEDDDEPISLTGKWFILKHTFKNVSKLENGAKAHSECLDHFGTFWRMHIYRNEEYLSFFTRCLNKTAQGIWSIEVDCEVKMLSKNGTPFVYKSCDLYKQFENEKTRYPNSRGWDEFEKWDVLEQEHLIDDSLTFEVSFKIKNMTGIYKNDLRCFNDPECSNIVLIVDDKKFYVAKMFLATHSSYFKSMFLGMFSDSKKSEIPLTGIDADDFQNYLEVLYGDNAIDEYTVEGIVLVADMYDTQIVIKKCQKFLMNESKKTLKKKLEMSLRYNLEDLKNKCLSEIKNIEDIRGLIPGDIKDLDPSLMAILFEKALKPNSVYP